jgi:hypothetical protein
MNERESGECEIEKRVAGLQRAVEEMSGRTDRDRIANLIATAKRPPEHPPVPVPVEPSREDPMADFGKSC